MPDAPPAPFTATRATAADAETAVGLVQRAARGLLARGIDQWVYYANDAGAALVRRRVDQHEVYLFHDPTGVPVATLCLQWADADYWGDRGLDGRAGYVHQLAVDPAAAGRGVGAFALAWAAARIRAAGRRYFRLDCLAENRALCDYYLRHGFAAAGTVQVGDRPAQRFERDLTPDAAA